MKEPDVVRDPLLPPRRPKRRPSVKGGAPSTMDYGRVWHGDDAHAVGESVPVKRRGVGLSVQLSADRSYCVVPCSAAGAVSPFVLRLLACYGLQFLGLASLLAGTLRRSRRWLSPIRLTSETFVPPLSQFHAHSLRKTYE